MAKVPPKSVYKSPKSVARNQTVPISVDDPRVAWDKVGQTRARQGAEIEVVGFDGLPLIDGGKSLRASVSPAGTGVVGAQQKNFVPPSDNGPGRFIDADLITPSPVTNVSAVWSGENLVITFNWDYDDPLNFTVAEFIVELTSDGVVLETPVKSFLANKTQRQQTVTVTEAINRSVFGDNFVVDFSSICVIAMDVFYNRSEKTCAATIPVYVLNLPIPIITVTEKSNGYSVSYQTLGPEYAKIYDAIEISEYESDAATEPTGVTYNVTFWDVMNPATVVVGSISPRWVKARFSSNSRKFTAYCAAQKVTPIDPIGFDSNPPTNDFALGTATVQDDPDGLFTFNKKVLFNWTANTDTSTYGYQIRFKRVGTTDYTYMSVPGRTTISTYLYGLKAGQTYEIGVNTYDQFGNINPLDWKSYPNIVIPASTSLAADVAITAGDMKMGYGIGGDNANKGLYLGPENYWYITGNTTSSSAARISVGGTNDKLFWNGTSLSVTGTVNANAGAFTGSVDIGTSTVDGQLRVTTSSGKFEIGKLTDTVGTKIGVGIQGTDLSGKLFQLDTTNGIIANKGTIGGWTISTESITKTTSGQGKIDINSAQGYIAISNTNEEDRLAGINAPTGLSDSVFWAGGLNANAETNAFRVNLAGQLFATSAEITGNITATGGNITGSMDVDGQLNVGNVTIESVVGNFSITDTIGGYGVISTSETGRLVLGHYQEDFGRQVKVARSAQIAGNPDGAGAANSGGLRNIFTSTVAQFYSNAYLNVNEANGDVVLLYTP